MVGIERVSGCIYCGNRESEWVYICWEHRESVCIYAGNIESERVTIWWEYRESEWV
jgi:hypothetical protein